MTATTDSDRAVSTWQRQIAPLADCALVAEQVLADIEGPLGVLYQRAEDTGDTPLRETVLVVWEKSQHLAAQIPPFVAALQGGQATMTQLQEQRNSLAREYNDLLAAIDDCDINDPRLANFAEVIESEVWDEAQEYAMDCASQVMYDEVYESFYEELVETFDIQHGIAWRFVAALRGDEDELTSYRRELIRSLLATWEAPAHD